MQVIHKKSGNRYWVINTLAKDCTNVRDGLPVVVYCRGDERDVPKNDWFVRDAREFFEKFDIALTDIAGNPVPDIETTLPKLVQTGRELGFVVTPSQLGN